MSVHFLIINIITICILFALSFASAGHNRFRFWFGFRTTSPCRFSQRGRVRRSGISGFLIRISGFLIQLLKTWPQESPISQEVPALASDLYDVRISALFPFHNSSSTIPASRLCSNRSMTPLWRVRRSLYKCL